MSLLGSIFGDSTTNSKSNSNKNNNNDIVDTNDKTKKQKKGKRKQEEGGGGDNGSNKNALIGLFQHARGLPERPNHTTFIKIATGKKKKKKRNLKEDKGNVEKNQEEKIEEGSPKKKRRKQRSENDGDEDEDDKEGKEAQVDDDDDDDDDNEEEDNEGDDDAGAEKKTIFVGNLPLATTTRKSLAALFKDCGPIESTRLRSIPTKGVKLPLERAGNQTLMKKVAVNTKQVDTDLKNTVLGYVVFKNVDAMEAALAKNNQMVQGFRIRVDRSSPTVDPSRSVFCGNLPYSAEESTLQDHFVKGCSLELADVEGVRIVRDNGTFQCKGFAYVLFREKNMVPLALKLHNSRYMNKNIRVQVCGKRFKGRRGSQKEKVKSLLQPKEELTPGAFRRILDKQNKEVAKFIKRKRGIKKSSPGDKNHTGLSKRAALDKKVDKRVKKIQKRISKGMGKARRS